MSQYPKWIWYGVGTLFVVLLSLPLVSLGLSSSPSALFSSIQHPVFLTALGISLKTTLLSLLVVVLMGTPLAWWLSRERGQVAKIVGVLVDVPIVIPPAVVGVAMLMAFGRNGVFGGWLESASITIPFTSFAVVLAQIVVSAPFYVQAATNAFRKVDLDTMIVARTLGATEIEALRKVAIPLAFPGLVAGASLAFARSLGEFGATLIFAGNMPGVTQTLPLAIYMTLESDLELAVAFSLVLVAIGFLLLGAIRGLSGMRTEA